MSWRPFIEVLFGKRLGEETEQFDLSKAKAATPCVRYVNLLILEAVGRGDRTLELVRDGTLPRVAVPASEVADVSPGQVLNRLKVMCGLTPERFPEPREGRFAIWVMNREYGVTCRFDDREEPACRLAFERVS